ncbi:SDR family oxidoreductase [Dactylosporangium aurantiacum]|uniref:SDR family oxidoreductase n=1 Tax=Dactylosporangium aurantiacum TaxID=35754 RepID=A0A9Q9IR31_9ACTN|nr:SDR family oxidoreductase [Dactylosporangium aurantiacum]MDG6106216.1 SDR family NAD(P)-dependent oxidoreductase [Dactylosporangium aurantiacum]UWZ58282.1 SDR family oxidoreductase [Dactylosporangium aurantiacum]
MAESWGSTAVVTGASRGFGRAVAGALAGRGATVVGVGRTAPTLRATAAQLGPAFLAEPGDATDPALAQRILREHRPGLVVLSAGAQPPAGPFHELAWADFARNWEMDVRQAYEWCGAALRLPLAPGSVVVVLSSGAALGGSPVSGGYAGAKATVRFVTRYAQEESRRAGLGIRFVALLPQLTPDTGFGLAAVASYARRRGADLTATIDGMRPYLTADQLADAVVALAGGGDQDAVSYTVSAAGYSAVEGG